MNQTFIGIMFFYAILSYVIFPVGFYYIVDKSAKSAGNGFVVGSLVSIALWLVVGRKRI
jgi:hypothetical protein